MKKELKSFIVISVILIVAIGFWYLWSRTKTEEIKIQKENIVKVIDSIDPNSLRFSANQDKIRYVSEDNQKIIEYDIKTDKNEEIYSVGQAVIIDSVWAPNSESVLLRIFENPRIYYRYLNLNSLEVKDLNENIQTVSFSPAGDRIVYWYSKNNQNSIAISKPDGSNWYAIYEFSDLEGDLVLFWPVKDKIYYYLALGTEAHSTDLYSLKVKKSNPKPQKVLNNYMNSFVDKTETAIIFTDDGMVSFDFTKDKAYQFYRRLFNITSCFYFGSNKALVVASDSVESLANSIYLVDLKNADWTKVLIGEETEGIKGNNILNIFYFQSDKQLFFTISKTLYKIKLDLSDKI